MRLAATGAMPRVMAMALTAMLSACAPYAHPVDPEQAAERAAIGAVTGAALGAGLGATLAIDPGLGAIIGTEAGGAIGAGIGVATTPPPPEYMPVVVPAAATGPRFYDNWPPSYHRPPDNPETQPPHAG